MGIAYFFILASPWIIRRYIAGGISPRSAAHYYFVSIIATGISTGLIITLILLRFLSGSLLASMGDACGGIFEAGHGFLAASKWNYLLSAAFSVVVMFNIAFLFGGGARLLRVSHQLKKKLGSVANQCPALPAIIDEKWAGRTLLLTDDEKLEAQTVGIIFPRILVSDGLVSSLNSSQLYAVITHEDAHRSFRDNLAVAIAKTVALTIFYFPGPKMALMEMRTCLETAADIRAAERAGGPLVIADTLARIARSSAKSIGNHAVTASVRGRGDISTRIEYLLNAPANTRRASHVFLFIALAIITVMVFASSAFTVVGEDQKSAFICFTSHEQAADNQVCPLDHS